MTALDPAQLVGLGGAAGAVLRYGVSRALAGRAFPVATLAVNAVGSFALALVTFANAGDAVLLAVGTGACGSFTTFSSFAFETVRLWEGGDRRLAAVNALGNLAAAGVGIGLAWLLVAG
ncbi:MAG: CrcB family protein [Halobacteriales archaeon]|nr:CrcB family protein [Halobacteriales archaeon]